MIVFENEGEIDPRMAMLIGVNVKESSGAIGYFGTGLKYAIACMSRWSEALTIQSGEHEFTFAVEEVEVRGKKFSTLAMMSRYDRAPLAYTTEMGKRWEPWMVYRELWCNAHDEPACRIYEVEHAPRPKAGLTRILVSGPKIEAAHATRNEFILEGRVPLHIVPGLEIYASEGKRIFYRGIAVQTPEKPTTYTYNITEHLWLTEDRTAGSWSTDPIIVRGLTQIQDKEVISATIAAPAERFESRLDYCYASTPGDVWNEIAERMATLTPMDVPTSVRSKFVKEVAAAAACPTCGGPMPETVAVSF